MLGHVVKMFGTVDRAAQRRQLSGDNPHQGRLAATVVSGQCDFLSAVDGQVEVAEEDFLVGMCIAKVSDNDTHDKKKIVCVNLLVSWDG